MKSQLYANWLKNQLETAPHGMKGALAQAMELDGPKLSHILAGERKISHQEVLAAADFLGLDAPDFPASPVSPANEMQYRDQQSDPMQESRSFRQINAGQASQEGTTNFPAAGKKILLIISGGIAAYKSLDLIRRLKERDVGVRAVMTKAAEQFITPLSVGALTAQKVHSELFDRDDEIDVGHIRLAREADLIVVAPATADLMAKMANGLADDLASAILLAAKAPILVAPAMNPAMWDNPASRRNVETLETDGVHFIGPNSGEMAEAGESGMGRMAEPMEIVGAIGALLDDRSKPLKGKRVIVTSGPTHEPIDPVRYIANRSSGKQGHAIAAALGRLGAEVILVSGPVNIPSPDNVELVQVQTAREMLEAVETAMPVDIAIMVAAVADWRSVNETDEKMKKENGKGPSHLKLTENPDILKTVGHHKNRPSLVVGFAAETENLVTHARAKLKRKNADWIVANDVSVDSGIGSKRNKSSSSAMGDRVMGGGVMGGDANRVKILSREGVEEWPELSKIEVAGRLAEKIAEHFENQMIIV